MQCDVSDSRREDSEKPHGLNHVLYILPKTSGDITKEFVKETLVHPNRGIL